MTNLGLKQDYPSKAKLFPETTFFIIIFTYLKSKYTGPNWPWRTEQLVPSLIFMEPTCQVLHGHFGPVYLLQVSRNDDEKRCFWK